MKGKALVKGLAMLVWLLMLPVSNVAALGEPCQGNFDFDQDVDADDITVFLQHFGRSQYNNPCPTSPCPITCDGTLSPLGRWCDQGNGTVKDMTTGLVWLKDAGWGDIKKWADCTTWDDAHTRAGTLYDGMAGEPFGLSDGSVEGDWRLPTKSELVGITTGTEYIRSSQMYKFDNVQSYHYWSSTSLALYADYAWGVSLVNGYVVVGTKDYYDYYVWPVRGGQ